ncbi:hypothetical protein [Aestuariivivens insulae]|uniref:hypothetical protein n=1 Tax=Aestuariivivens insulae TaxID=1621988 RepID=UPI001F5A223C|nr:hypothetical protein [Aestuariivivens insulae]
MDAKFFKAQVVNGQISKEKQVFTIRHDYHIDGNFFTGKIAYNAYGLVTEIYYPNNKGAYYLKDNYYYNEYNNVIKAVMTMLELNDSIVLKMTYDPKGHLLTTRWNKQSVPIKGWFKKLFYKYFSRDLVDEDYHRYFLSSENDLKGIQEAEFDSITLINNHYFELFDAKGNLLKEKYRYVDTTQIGPLEPKTIDTITVQWEYEYFENGLLKNKRKNVEKRSLQKGLPPMRMYDNSITTWEYNYNSKDKIKEEIKIIEQKPSKTGFLKIKGNTRTFKRTHEYLDGDKKHVIYTYDDKGALEYVTTKIFDEAHKLIEIIVEGDKRKSVDRYDERGNHTSHALFKKNKKISEFTAKYTYDSYGNWISCMLSDNQKNKPQYVLIERTIDYYQ